MSYCNSFTWQSEMAGRQKSHNEIVTKRQVISLRILSLIVTCRQMGRRDIIILHELTE